MFIIIKFKELIKKYFKQYIAMAWYGSYNQTAKQIDSLVDSKASLAALLLSSQLLTHIKSSYAAKTLDYLTNASCIGPQLVTYLSVPPTESDSIDRKYKLPTLAIQLVTAQQVPTTINVLLKPQPQGPNYFLQMYDLLKKKQILPLLAGYFNRVNMRACQVRYMQALDSIYSSNQYVLLLIEHSYNENIATCIVPYLCIQSVKSIVFTEDKVNMKLGFVRSIMDKIQSQRLLLDQKSKQSVENLFIVIRQIVQKYYLINNGKQMLEIILQEKHVETIIGMITQQSDLSFPAMNMALSFLKYYSLSSMNTEDSDQQKFRKNIQRLQNQPFVKIMMSSFRSLLEKVKKQKSITLYGYHLLQVLCHFITLFSPKILQTLKDTQLFPTLIDLLFKHEQNNILHKLIQRTFYHIFSTDKMIYQLYKQYMFCEISLIDLTAKRLLELFPGQDCLEKAKKKGYFGVLIRIIKNYSSIVTTNNKIKDSITMKTEIWNKMSKKVLKPYQASCKQQIGELKDVPQTAPTEYTVSKIQNSTNPRFIQNTQNNNEAIEQIKKQQQTMPKTLQLTEIKKQVKTLSDPNTPLSETKIEDDSFFKSPLDDTANKRKNNFGFLQNSQGGNSSGIVAANNIQQVGQQHKRSTSFTQFIQSQKQKVGEQIKMQRSLSGEKRLSADKKVRMTSNSPSKRNNWAVKDSTEQEKTEKKKETPKIPNVNKLPPHFNHSGVLNNLAIDSNNRSISKANEQQIKKMTTSMPNLSSLKNVTVVRTSEQPNEKKYRKVQPKDKAFFDYLGLKY